MILFKLCVRFLFLLLFLVTDVANMSTKNDGTYQLIIFINSLVSSMIQTLRGRFAEDICNVLFISQSNKWSCYFSFEKSNKLQETICS